MAINLTSLPIELLLQICKRLPSDADLHNLRLVCRFFGDVGLPALGTTVTFALVPESIARLRDISLHPFFRRHISTVVCLMNVFYPYNNFGSWKQSITYGTESGYPVPLAAFSEDQWAESVTHYNALLAGQDEAFKALEPSQDIEIACRRFSKLQNLDIRDSQDTELPDHLLCNRAYQSLSQRHGDLTHCFVLPAYDFDVFSPKIALPGVYLLASLLRAMGGSQLSTLQVDALAIDVFNDEEGVYSQMRDSVQNLRTLKLCIWAAPEDDERQMADRILAKNRLKTFLCSAPRLEEVELSINAAFFGTGIYYANADYILPREHTWPHIRTLRFSQVELVPSHFLDFLSSHSQTLETLELKDCAVAPSPNQGMQLQRCRWSDILVPLATAYSLPTLSLSGWLTISPSPEQDQDMAVAPPMNMKYDKVKNVSLSVGKAVEIVTCSKKFHSFLREEMARCKNLDMETKGDTINGLVFEIKEGIIQDLMDRESAAPADRQTGEIPTRYVEHLKSFILLNHDYDSDTSDW